MIALDAEMVYAELIRRPGESLDELHTRLDQIVGEVVRGEREPVNEVAPEARAQQPLAGGLFAVSVETPALTPTEAALT